MNRLRSLMSVLGAAAADGAPVVQVGALVTPTTVRDAIARAADEAVATGHPVYVQY